MHFFKSGPYGLTYYQVFAYWEITWKRGKETKEDGENPMTSLFRS